MSEKLKGIKELLIESAHILKSDYRTLLPISGIYTLYLFLASVLYPRPPLSLDVGSKIIFVLHSLRLLIYFWIFISIIYALKERESKRRVERSLQDGILLILPFLMGYIILRLFMLLGLVFFVAPMIIFFVWYSLFPYVMVFEGETGVKALRRSRNLVKGYWVPVFLRYLLLIFGAIFLRNILEWMTRDLPNIGFHIVPLIYFPHIIFFDSWRSFFAFPYIFVGAPLVDLFFIPYLVIFVCLIYLDLKRIKEVSKNADA